MLINKSDQKSNQNQIRK